LLETQLNFYAQSIVRLQEALPKLGREKMENFNSECRAIKEMIEFEMKTTDDYIANMDLKEKLEERLNALQVCKSGLEIMKQSVAWARNYHAKTVYLILRFPTHFSALKMAKLPSLT
jgi:spore cortex formation protein SpoVR/YcgB (stage V sporulation)